jgi:hypothetical protein
METFIHFSRVNKLFDLSKPKSPLLTLTALPIFPINLLENLTKKELSHIKSTRIPNFCVIPSNRVDYASQRHTDG